jgi:hypothetical protein
MVSSRAARLVCWSDGKTLKFPHIPLVRVGQDKRVRITTARSCKSAYLLRLSSTP